MMKFPNEFFSMRRLSVAILGLAILASASPAWAVGINTNTAIKPGEGQFVYRTQLRFLQSHSSPAPADIDVNLIIIPTLLAYGVRENFTVIGVVPVVIREGTRRPPSGGVFDLDDQDFADSKFLGIYRFYQKDVSSETTRWSVLGGIEAPSYDEVFSSKSWDPFVGTVWTYQSQKWGLDLDLVWKFNTGEGFHRHDNLFYDAAYTKVLLTGQNLVDEKYWQVNAVLELNGTYTTNDSHLVVASPGIQLALESYIVEASLQLPVVRALKNGLEPDFLFAVGTRITW